MDPTTDIPLHTGRSMPALGLGTWQLTDDTAGVVSDALQSGYRMIDTSGDYGTQPGIGEGIKRSGVSRDSFFITTKVEETDDAYDKTVSNLDQLDLQSANLMLIHRPPRNGAGINLWQGLIRAREEGLVDDIGVSNYSAAQMDELIDATGEVPVVNQVEWSPLGYSEDLLDYANERGVVIQAYSPLTRQTRLDEPAVVEIASAHGKSPAQVLLRWNIQHRTVPLPKANRLSHVKENIEVFDFELSQEEMAKLDGLNEHYSALGKLPYV